MKKKYYRALSSGLIYRDGVNEHRVEKNRVYEWGEEQAKPYFQNAPENFVECSPDGKPLKNTPKTKKA